MFPPEKNNTLYQIIYNALVDNDKTVKNFKEFGFYNYCIFPDSKESKEMFNI